MRKIKSTVHYRVPDGPYCNHNLHGKEPRCRFCTEHKKGFFVCVLHNEYLVVEQAVLIVKHNKCLTAKWHKDNEIIDSEPQQNKPTVPVQEIVKSAVLTYKKALNELLDQGYSYELADRLATEDIMKGVKK